MLPSGAAVLLMLLATCSAQNLDFRNSPAELYLSPSNSSECDSRLIRNEALIIRIYQDFSDSGCINLADLEILPINDATCPPGNETCPYDDFQAVVFGGVTPNDTALSRALFQVRPPLGDDQTYVTNTLSIRTFEGRDCRESAPWTLWGNCNETDPDLCTDLGYSVGSFRFFETSEANRTDGACVVAAPRGVPNGAGSKNVYGSITTVLLAAIVSSIFQFLG